MALIKPEQLRSGSYSITGSFSGSFYGDLNGTSSYSLTSSYVEIAQTASYYNETDPIFTSVSGTFVLTSSFNSFTSSYYIDSASFDINILNNSASIALLSGSFENVSSSFSTRVTDLENFSSSLDATFATDAELNAATASLSASIANLSSSFEIFSGSYNTGSFTGSFIGDLIGTSSWTENAQTASYVETAQTASYISASNIDGIVLSSSYSLTASYVENAQTASYVLQAVSASYALSSSYALSASRAISSSYALSASYALSSSYSITSSYSNTSTSASHATFADTASLSFRTTQTDVLVLNQSGQNIAKGVVVRITGSNTSSDIPRIVTASYENDNNSANTLGITIEAISNGSQGYVITEGILTGVNTQGFISGQLVYLGATGSIIGTAPIAPLHTVRLGEVIRHQTNNGSIYVRIDNGYELEELHDVLITSATSGQSLVRSGSLWINSNSLTGSLFGTASYATVANSVNNLNQNVFISGSLTVLQGATIFGSSSFQYVTSSQLAVSASFISVNVFEPVERFGGLKVYDSGSSLATASLAWDSLHNHWVYQNISGATYTGGMFLSGPRNTGSLGDEPNLTKWYIPRSDGGDHLDDSQIYSSGSTHIITGSLTVTTGVTASLFGTASWANNSITASFAQTSQTASYALNALSASYATLATTASYIDGGFY